MMTRSTSSAFCMEPSDGHEHGRAEAARPGGSADCQRAMAGNARRQPRHSRQRRHRGFCKLQNLKELEEFEPHPLRQLHLRRHGDHLLLGGTPPEDQSLTAVPRGRVPWAGVSDRRRAVSGSSDSGGGPTGWPRACADPRNHVTLARRKCCHTRAPGKVPSSWYRGILMVDRPDM